MIQYCFVLNHSCIWWYIKLYYYKKYGNLSKKITNRNKTITLVEKNETILESQPFYLNELNTSHFWTKETHLNVLFPQMYYQWLLYLLTVGTIEGGGRRKLWRQGGIGGLWQKQRWLDFGLRDVNFDKLGDTRGKEKLGKWIVCEKVNVFSFSFLFHPDL